MASSATTNDMQSPNRFTYQNLDIREVTTDTRPLRIYLDGVFDMTHFGHFRLFKSVKDKFPNSTIIVGVSSDEETIRLKGQTLMNEAERAETISHCKWVDEVVCPCPWIITQQFIDEQNIDYVAHDGLPYVSANSTDIYDFVKKQGRFIATQRTTGVSTTELINRIVRRYNEFVLRNLKRGVQRQDLNVSWTRARRIEMQNGIKKIESNVEKWIEDPHTFVEDFTKIFGKDGKIKDAVEKKLKKERDEIIAEGGFRTWSLKWTICGVAGLVAGGIVSRHMTQYRTS